MTNAYALFGESATPTAKYNVVLDGYGDGIVSEDTVETGITGLPLIHRSTLHRLWSGAFILHSSDPAEYGTVADLKALFYAQATLYFQPPELDTAVGVKWIGNWMPAYMRPPLDIVTIPFMLREASP